MSGGMQGRATAAGAVSDRSDDDNDAICAYCSLVGLCVGLVVFPCLVFFVRARSLLSPSPSLIAGLCC